MKHLNNYITEYIIKKKLDKPIYSGTPILYTPKNNGELVDLIIKLLFNKTVLKVFLSINQYFLIDYLVFMCFWLGPSIKFPLLSYLLP